MIYSAGENRKFDPARVLRDRRADGIPQLRSSRQSPDEEQKGVHLVAQKSWYAEHSGDLEACSKVALTSALSGCARPQSGWNKLICPFGVARSAIRHWLVQVPKWHELVVEDCEGIERRLQSCFWGRRLRNSGRKGFHRNFESRTVGGFIVTL
jgi:hypothetical protein